MPELAAPTALRPSDAGNIAPTPASSELIGSERPKRIAFTGHRDKIAAESELLELAAEYPNAIWVHGGARGFDEQVRQIASRCGITQEVIRPDYHTHPAKQAPLLRNLQIITDAALLVACYDGRQSGGTFFTINRARANRTPVRILTPR